jgi:hypothetical protein
MQRCKSKINYIFKPHTKINLKLEILERIETTSMKIVYRDIFTVKGIGYLGSNQTERGI